MSSAQKNNSELAFVCGLIQFLEKIITSSCDFVVQQSSSVPANEDKKSDRKGDTDRLWVYEVQAGHLHHIPPLELG